MSACIRILDLCCKAGGAGMGYNRAGFEVVGVDLEPQPRYPFEFIQADIFGLEPAFLATFDAIHVSPACQGYTALRHAPGAIGKPRQIAETRAMIKATGKPYVIENVPGAEADLIDPIMLCGSMFRELEVQHLGETVACLRRHRLFECSFPVEQPKCRHDPKLPVIGIYGGHARIRAASWGGRGTKDTWPNGHLTAASQAMRIDWMTLAELSEAIPPPYTTFIGKRLAAHIRGGL